MYEAGYRMGREVVVSNVNEIIEQFTSQRNYYAASLCCLNLCCHDYQWLVRPAGTDKGTTPTLMSNKNSCFAEAMEVITYEQLVNEYHIISAKCQLLRQHPEVANEISGKCTICL